MYSLTSEELERQSAFSPGPVQCDEELLRTLIHPDHVQNGEVTAAAISLSDLRSRGFSVDRIGFTTRARVQAGIDRYVSRNPERIAAGLPPRTGAEVAKFKCRSIREVVDGESKRAFTVIDDGIKDNDAHAKILSYEKKGEAALRKLRSILIQFLNDKEDIDGIEFPLDKHNPGESL